MKNLKNPELDLLINLTVVSIHNLFLNFSGKENAKIWIQIFPQKQPNSPKAYATCELATTLVSPGVKVSHIFSFVRNMSVYSAR